jgi:hypothetical protein
MPGFPHGSVSDVQTRLAAEEVRQANAAHLQLMQEVAEKTKEMLNTAQGGRYSGVSATERGRCGRGNKARKGMVQALPLAPMRTSSRFFPYAGDLTLPALSFRGLLPIETRGPPRWQRRNGAA